MVKKDFRKNIAQGADKFFSANDDKTHQTHEPQGTHGTHKTHKTQFRINLRLEAGHEEYLKEQAWKTKQSITQYINGLIQADRDTQDTFNILDTQDTSDT